MIPTLFFMPIYRNYRTVIRFQLYFVICFVSILAGAQQAKLSPGKLTSIEAAVAKFMSTTHVPGVAVSVVENGEYEWSEGFGSADLENNVPVSEHTLFRLASVSKPITATAAMQLWERGQLDLDAPIQKYCPSFPQKSQPITTRQLLGHLGGIRHYKNESQDDPEIGNTHHFDDPIQSGLKFFENDPLLSAPGTHFNYSTHGYTVIGCVIEGASGSKYVDFVRRNVITPARMEHTQVDDRFAVIPYRTRFYQKTESGSVLNSDFLDSSYKIPGGGWLSSAEDMARYEAAILNDKLVRHSTRELMWTPLKAADGSEDTYGMGWGVTNAGGLKQVGHTGGQQGTNTAIFLAPDNRTGVVVLTNMEDAGAGDLARELLKIVVTAGGGK
ncbi:MAG TPA: serine hydrolase domain-containing protein [Candidatus Sulfotelmatobacter sp.]